MIFLNGHEVTPTIFPDQTSQVWKLSLDDMNRRVVNGAISEIEWIFESENEFMHIAQLKDLLDTISHKVYLTVPYLPYARQDKGIQRESTFALHTFAKLLNALKFDRVTCFDPHSDVARRIINNFREELPDSIIEALSTELGALLCFPDKGAVEKYSRMNKPYIYGEKIRDRLTGWITDYHLSDTGSLEGTIILIIDDICDGGATFVHLVKRLKLNKAQAVHLFVSHGIFSKGTQILHDSGIDRIFTRKGEII